MWCSQHVCLQVRPIRDVRVQQTWPLAPYQQQQDTLATRSTFFCMQCLMRSEGITQDLLGMMQLTGAG